MLNHEFEQVLRKHLKYLKPAQELQPEDDLKSLGLDSMASIDLLLDLEDHFDVVLPDSMLTENTFSTAGSLWDIVSTLKKQLA